MRSFVFCLLALPSLAVAADLPRPPAKPVAVRKELLFSDDFQGASPSPLWHRVVDTFALQDGVLIGTQTRVQDQTAADGRVIKAHAAVHGLELPTRDSVVECRIRLDGATMVDVEFTDRKYTGSHYGHICRAQVRPTGVTLIDERDGNMRSDIYEMKKDPAKKAEVAKLIAGRQVTYPLKVEAGRWYDLVVETAGDEMRVTLDGKAVGYLKSSGIAHATKSKIEFGVAGQTGSFDDLKVWNAGPRKP
jgi:hypothetical protein